ncbi:CopD family protein [Marinagarivorans algicola]|uniref:CopD family protein n=1 Tax=Marinagarivorans algicola TaxID=1513270 RepID=UPI0006B9BCD9|nr:CopD family protein [Marinagarivorans algicola]
MLFLWVKAFHIMAVVAWFAVLFYLPRLFVYHASCDDVAGRERFKIMERKLYRGIGAPSMILVWTLGAWMAYLNWDYYKTQGWFHAKLTLVFLLTGYHHMCGAYVKKFARDFEPPSHVFFRWFNEVPVLFLAAIVIMVVVRPF